MMCAAAIALTDTTFLLSAALNFARFRPSVAHAAVRITPVLPSVDVCGALALPMSAV